MGYIHEGIVLRHNNRDAIHGKGSKMVKSNAGDNPKKQKEPTMLKRVAYIGLGRRGASFVQRFRELGLLGTKMEIVGAYDVDIESAGKCAKNVGIDIPIFNEPKRLFKETCLDAVIIASYENAHLDNFRTIPSDIPVFIEKPLADTVENAREIVTLARERKAPVVVGHCMRFAPILQRAKQVVDEGRIGRINSFRFHCNVHYGHVYFRTWMRLRANVGDAIIEKGCHDFDILHVLTGSTTEKIINSAKRFEYGGDKPNNLHCSVCPEASICPNSLKNLHLHVLGESVPEELQALGRSLCVYAKEIDIKDDNICLLQLRNGVHGTYVQTLYTPYSFKGRLYTLIGSEGVLEIDLGTYEGDLRIYPRYGSKNELSHEHFDYHSRNHYNGDLFMIQHFFDVMSGVAEPICTVEDGYLAVATAEAASKSAEGNKMVDVI